MTITKFITQSNRITAREVLRESEQCVWVSTSRGERREAKITSFTHYHDSWEAARDFLLKSAEGRVRNARAVLQRTQDELGNIKGMKNPGKAVA